MTDTLPPQAPLIESDHHARPLSSLQQLRQALLKQVTGQEGWVDALLGALLAQGHLLIEGPVGVGKTLLVRSLVAGLEGNFGRIHCRPDQASVEIAGAVLQEADGPRLRRGPLFSQWVLIEDLPRSSAWMQSTLLDALQDQQILLEGRILPLAKGAMIIATRSSTDVDLPVALRDRFISQLRLDLPSEAQERDALRLTLQRHYADPLDTHETRPLLPAQELASLRAQVTRLPITEPLLDYGLRLVRLSRDWPAFEQGAGPRAAQGLLRLAQAQALLRGANAVAVEDLRQVLPGVLRARVRLTAEREFEGDTLEGQVLKLLAQCPGPRR